MLDLLLKLIDRFIDLAQRRREDNRRFFSDFVAPAMTDFEAVHKDYLDSFKKYGDLVTNESFLLNEDHPVFSAIRKDNLFSDGLRGKVKVAYASRSNWYPIAGLLGAMEAYLTGLVQEPAIDIMISDRSLVSRYGSGMAPTELTKKQAEMLIQTHPSSVTISSPSGSAASYQVWRASYSANLAGIVTLDVSESAKRKAALVALDVSVDNLQRAYQRVLSEYEQARTRLLKAK
jgi:hypothetical protein